MEVANILWTTEPRVALGGGGRGGRGDSGQTGISIAAPAASVKYTAPLFRTVSRAS